MMVAGQPRTWLRLEGLAVLAASVLFYRWQLGSWTTFALWFFAADLSLAAYLAGPATGARLYNLTHNYVGPIFLATYSLSIGRADMVAYALIWMAHIGFDRMLGLSIRILERIGGWPQARVSHPCSFKLLKHYNENAHVDTNNK